MTKTACNSSSIEVYERFFAVMNAIFKDECPPPYHDFDSGDCYLLLAQAYLAIGEEEKAMDAVESSIMYYIDLLNRETDSEKGLPVKPLAFYLFDAQNAATVALPSLL
jgi:hypothetical protein